MTTTTTAKASQAETGPAAAVAALDELTARMEQMAVHLAELQQVTAERGNTGGKGKDQPPLYSTVEEWVCNYLLPTFPRPVGEVGLTRWHWCEQWWRHDEAVTRLTALWYGWEHARLEMTGMLGWLRELDHHLPILCGEDGPFRECATSGALGEARHRLPDVTPTEPAPPEWWSWWD
jgi:hypothetical protein